MEETRHVRLNEAVDVIHLRFGEHALAAPGGLRGKGLARPELGGCPPSIFDRLPATEGWACGVPAVDRLTGIDGLPRGRISVLGGRGSCGKWSLGLAMLAQATRELASAIVIDPGRSFDPWALLEYRPDLRNLTVVRPPSPDAAGEAAVGLAKAGAGYLLLSLPQRVAAQAEPWLPLLAAAAERAETVVVALVEEAPRSLAHAASLSLAVERTTWKLERGELVGLRARVTCVKNKLSLPGRVAEIEVNYPLGAGLFPDSGVGEVEQAWVETEERESAVV